MKMENREYKKIIIKKNKKKIKKLYIYIYYMLY